MFSVPAMDISGGYRRAAEATTVQLVFTTNTSMLIQSETQSSLNYRLIQRTARRLESKTIRTSKTSLSSKRSVNIANHDPIELIYPLIGLLITASSTDRAPANVGSLLFTPCLRMVSWHLTIVLGATGAAISARLLRS